jgi:hypothetical protein
MRVRQRDIVEDVVCQLISGYTERDVLKKCSRVNESVFLEIVEKIKKTIF